jgi:hypothetical protein
MSVTSILAVLGSIVGAGVTVVMLVLLAACAPNSSPEQSAQLQRLVLMILCGGGVGLIGCIVCLCLRRAPLALAMGLSPIVVSIGVIYALASV